MYKTKGKKKMEKHSRALGMILPDFSGRPAIPGDVGLEFEVEGNLNAFVTKNWTVKPDGSLRNGGLEWITVGAQPIDRIPEVIHSWFENAKANKCNFKRSLRTSIHVHINACNFSLLQIYTIITAYWFIENLLVRYSGPSREGNLFCLRIKDADYLLSKLMEGFKNQNYLLEVGSNDYKYAALNLQALTKYNSFEFRMMRGEYTDPRFIIEWVEELYNLVHEASKFSSPQEVVKEFKQSNPLRFLEKFFSKNFCQKLVAELPDFYSYMEENFHYAFALATAIDDWSAEKQTFVNKKTLKAPKYTFITDEIQPTSDIINQWINTNTVQFNPFWTTTNTPTVPAGEPEVSELTPEESEQLESDMIWLDEPEENEDNL